jgi:hypothetical protein
MSGEFDKIREVVSFYFRFLFRSYQMFDPKRSFVPVFHDTHFFLDSKSLIGSLRLGL